MIEIYLAIIAALMTHSFIIFSLGYFIAKLPTKYKWVKALRDYRKR